LGYIGPEWSVMTGQAGAEALEFGWLAMVHDDDRSGAREAVLTACQSSCAFTMKYRLRRVDGSYAWIVSGAAPSYSPVDGQFVGFLGSAKEIPAEQAERNIAFEFLLSPAGPSPSTNPIDVISDQVLLARLQQSALERRPSWRRWT